MDEMRQYKFRAWTSKRMEYDYRDACLWNGLLFAEGDTILMQWTGMKDKHGKDIYEGDRVRGEHGAGWIEWDNTKGAWRVQMYTGWHALDSCELEVIGHIYEPAAPQEYIDRDTGVRLTVLQDDGKGNKDISLTWSEGSAEDNEKINAAIRRLMQEAGVTPPESET